jgi:hypothetical protein
MILPARLVTNPDEKLTGSVYRADMYPMARNTIQPTITSEVTAPAMIPVISLGVIGPVHVRRSYSGQRRRTGG